MNKILLIFAFMAFMIPSKVMAQLPNGSIAPDWVLTDLNGNTHHLYEYLDDGYTVYIDMFATWCQPCWNYHQQGHLKNLYNAYGPDGEDKVMVFGIEADMSTPTNCIYNIDCPSSRGDWTHDVPYPIIDITSSNGPGMPNDYMLAYYPTIYAICPNREITEIGQVAMQAFVNFMNNCPLPPPLAFNYSTIDIQCSLDPLGSVILNVTGGKTPYTFQWSTGYTGQHLVGVGPGVYSCIISDADGTTLNTGNITIHGPSSLPTITETNYSPSSCEQPNASASVSVTGGDGNYTFAWSNGANTSSIQNVLAGTYSVSIHDGMGCSTSTTININNLPSPDVQIQAQGQLSCDNPTVQITSNGSSTGPQYTYSWTTSNGSILSDPLTTEITVGSAGLYVLTIFDNELNCLNTNFIQISGVAGLPIANAGPDKTLPCSGGVITLNGSGSSSGNNFSYEWTTTDGNIIGNPNQLTIEVDQNGTYILYVTNESNECQASDAVVVSTNNTIDIDAQVNNIKCNGNAEGSITILHEEYNYAWSNGATSSAVSNLSAGSYQVTITNDAGCTHVESFNITQPSALQLSLQGTDASSADVNDGSVTAMASGGVAPLKYAWSNGGTTATISGLAPGIYEVIITDANGCSVTSSYAVNVAGCLLDGIAQVENANCYGSETGNISLVLENATGEVTIEWNNGASSSNLENVPAGNYNAIIRDEAGCFLAINASITQPTQISIDALNIDGPECPSDNTGSIEITAIGGNGNYSFQWSNGMQGPAINNLAAGDYTVIITDDTNCSVERNVTVKSKDIIKPELIVKTAIFLVDGNGNANITFDNIDNGSYDNCGSFQATFEPATFTCDQLGIQTVKITLTDAAGNQTTGNVEVEIVDVVSPTWNSCPNGTIYASSCNGLLNIDLGYSDNCNQEIQFTQLAGQDIQNEFPIGTTTQRYVIVDNAGNTNVCEFIVQRDQEMLVTANITNATCDNIGSIEVITTQGSHPHTFEWSSEDSSSYVQVQPGDYTVTITDASGCEMVITYTIEGPFYYAIIADDYSADLGGQNGYIHITLNNDDEGLTFEWTKNGEFFASTQNLDNVENGIYELTITSDNGCVYGPFEYNLNTINTHDVGYGSKFTLYPNPAQSFINVAYNGEVHNANITIYNALGVKVYFEKQALQSQNIQIATDQFTSGIYHMIIDNGQKRAVKTFSILNK